MNKVRPLSVGERVLPFRASTASNLRYAFDSVAGRYVVLLFYGSSRSRPAGEALAVAAANRGLFDDLKACFFGVTTDPADKRTGLTKDALPGVRHFHDFDLEVSRKLGRAGSSYHPGWMILDPTLRVLAQFSLDQGEAALAFLGSLPPPEDHAGTEMHAPVLIVPRVFEHDFCRELIELYDRHGGQDSGFMREVDGITRPVLDHEFKRRADFVIEDQAVRKSIAARVQLRLRPEIKHCFHFDATRMERYLVACYDAVSGGHFRPHRDNTTKGTAHRRFAVTINLNADEYEGGDLCFPEYGRRTYRAPTGGAVVFSCSLLHEAQPVTRGPRYAFLPFLYDEAAAELREKNNPYLDPGISPYSRTLAEQAAHEARR